MHSYIYMYIYIYIYVYIHIYIYIYICIYTYTYPEVPKSLKIMITILILRIVRFTFYVCLFVNVLLTCHYSSCCVCLTNYARRTNNIDLIVASPFG